MSKELAIPKELESLAVSLSGEKKLEIVSAVKSVFENVQKMRLQLEAVNVVDENDKVSMRLANTLRLAMRNERLTAERFIDSKREAVQMLMSDFKTEDALWLKTKQLMQIETKAFEDLAKYKETTGERILAERKATLEAQRQLEVSKYTEYPAANLSAMGQPVYDAYMDGLVLAYNAKIEADAKAEAERLAAIEAERLEQIRIKEENARLQAEAEQKEKELAAERAKAESERKALEEKARKEREQAEAILKAEQEKARVEAEAERKKQADILAKQQAEAKRIQNEKDAENARLQAELKAKADKEAAELKAKQSDELAAKKASELAAKAPFKEKATKWVESFSIPEFTESNTATDDIKLKFEAYKKWAVNEIAKL